MSNGGAIEHEQAEEAGANAPPLAGLPPDFRTTWNRIGLHITSEHGRFVADVFEAAGECRRANCTPTEHDRSSYAEDLFLGDASVGVYLLERGDAGVRFAVADDHGRTVADGDAGTESCTRCHSGVRNEVFDVHQ